MKVLELGEKTLGYATFNPGWKWSKDMKAKAGTDSCQVTQRAARCNGHGKRAGSHFVFV